MTTSAPPLQDFLGEIPLFAGLGPTERRSVADACQRIVLARGERLYSEGDPCESFFIVESGRIRVFREAPGGRSQVVHQMGPRQSFAEAAVFGGGRFPASAEAAEASVVIAVAKEPFLRELRRTPAVAERIIASLSMWIHRLLDRVEELTRGSAASRLAHFVVRLPAHGSKEGLRIRFPLPKREVAAQLNIAPETLSRVLHDWKESGIVELRGREIEVRDLARLEQVAGLDDGP